MLQFYSMSDLGISTGRANTNGQSNGYHDEPSTLEFPDLPPFPEDVTSAPLLRISLDRLRSGDEAEVDRLWKACCELGFFYLDLRATAGGIKDAKSPEIDTQKLLSTVDDLFKVGDDLLDLPVSEKIKYDFKAKGSYFGYKGYGDGVLDSKATRDRNEFYNVRCSYISRGTIYLKTSELIPTGFQRRHIFLDRSFARA